MTEAPSTVVLEKLKSARIAALKVKDRATSSLLSTVVAAAQEKAKNTKVGGQWVQREANDEDVIAVLRDFIKKNEDSATECRKAGRSEKADEVVAPNALLASFLPSEPTEDEMLSVINTLLSGINAPSMKQMGLVMNGLNSSFGRRLNRAKAAPLVKARLK